MIKDLQNHSVNQKSLMLKILSKSIVFTNLVVFAGFYQYGVLVFEIFMRYALNNPFMAHETTIFIWYLFYFWRILGVVRNKHIRVVCL